ncbi:MAG TPA: hypothetical protein VEZ90_06545, partial [Blastocatellia bacterium]|nr:hypothetical protein [Blastocatellia bacterium]
ADREERETLFGAEFDHFRETIDWALAEALGGVRWADPKTINILGNAQLGLPFHLGHYFNRSVPAHLFAHTRGLVFTNMGQQWHTPLEGGNPACETNDARIDEIRPGIRADSLALVLSTERYLHAVLEHLGTQPSPPAVKWVKSGMFEKSEQVMSYIADVVALLMRLKGEHKLQTVYLYCGLPFSVVPLLAANLRYVVPNLVFMEYRSDLQDRGAAPGEMYVALPQA